MYTKEDLKKAFEAGEELGWVTVAESEGYTCKELEYEDFEKWFSKIFTTKTDEICGRV